ncbi:MAG: phenylalanine--tRNA ligase subunit alpha [Nitrospinota bacterium]|nr:phenylalanine--tRNA ligase subunit alpha [Nitrospinota bacterium]
MKLDTLDKPADEKELNDLRVKYLGKKGEVTLLSQKMRDLSNSEKPEAGKLLSDIRNHLETFISKNAQRIKQEKIQREIKSEFFDVTLPGVEVPFGTRHPISAVMEEIIDIFVSLGFQVEEGPELESDYYNFEALNFPPEHPARDMQDTFHVEGYDLLLRTHTSPVQIRSMEKYPPPLAVIAPGKVYRCDADVTHSPMFHQIEGFAIDENITFGDLKGTLNTFIHRLYGPDTKTRFRPSFFPFTEPSAEMDVSCVICGGKGCRVCKQTGWLEILGCGMIHPNVLRMAKIDPEKWPGFAFGMGLERVAMLKHGIADIRLLFDNDIRFLRQFR